MKRLLTIVLLATIQVVVLAQRGKVRPEWDFDGGYNVLRHDTNDDMWSFLLVIGAVVLYFLYYYIKGHSKWSNKKNNIESNSFTTQEDTGYSGEYINMGYSSSMPLDGEIQSGDEDSLLMDNSNISEKKDRQINGWIQYGEAYSLKDIWKLQYPGLYEKIDGSLADVVAIYFASGDKSLRIRIPFTDGTYKELKLYGKTNLEEGDQVDISTIIGFEMHKQGLSPIIRYDGVIHM